MVRSISLRHYLLHISNILSMTGLSTCKIVSETTRKRIVGFLVPLRTLALGTLKGHCSVLATLLMGLRALSAERELEELTVHSLDQYDLALAAAPTPASIPPH